MLHIGVIALLVLDAFVLNGLDSERFGLFFLDEWAYSQRNTMMMVLFPDLLLNLAIVMASAMKKLFFLNVHI